MFAPNHGLSAGYADTLAGNRNTKLVRYGRSLSAMPSGIPRSKRCATDAECLN
jgi:hypothetical protein